MFKSFSKGHRYDDIEELQTDLKKMDSRNHPDRILDISLANFGLYNIDSIEAAANNKKDERLKMTFGEFYMLKRLFDMKKMEKKGNMEGAAKIKRDAIETYKQDKRDDATAAKITTSISKSRDLGLSKEKTGEVIERLLKLAESPELSLTERLARLKDPNAKGLKSKKRRGTKKRRGQRSRGRSRGRGRQRSRSKR
jgi:hypothetical protein